MGHVGAALVYRQQLHFREQAELGVRLVMLCKEYLVLRVHQPCYWGFCAGSWFLWVTMPWMDLPCNTVADCAYALQMLCIPDKWLARWNFRTLAISTDTNPVLLPHVEAMYHTKGT